VRSEARPPLGRSHVTPRKTEAPSTNPARMFVHLGVVPRSVTRRDSSCNSRPESLLKRIAEYFVNQLDRSGNCFGTSSRYGDDFAATRLSE
jgi:hypothetical protein